MLIAIAWRMILGLFLLTGLTIAGEAVRSYFVGDLIEWRMLANEPDWRTQRSIAVSTGNGRAIVAFLFERRSAHVSFFPMPGDNDRTFRWRQLPPNDLLDMGWSQSWFGRCGFAYFHWPPYAGDTYQSRRCNVAAPLWFVSVTFLLLPALAFCSLLRRRWRLRDSRCVQCGYDLRASRDRCPECGTAIPAVGGMKRGN